MKKKVLLALTVMFTFCMCMQGCGGGANDAFEQGMADAVNSSESKESVADSNESQTQAEDPKQEDSKEPESTAPEDDGIINFDGDGYNVTYTGHETSTDYEGKPCVIIYYNFTNNGEKNMNAAFSSYFKVFQNGIECETAIKMDAPDSYENYMKDIQPGTTIEVCQIFSITDTSDLTVEVSDLISFDSKKDTQILTLEE